MLHAEQITLTERLFEHIDQGSTATSALPYQQPVNEYICPQIAQREAEVFFRRSPLCLGLSGLLPKPGSYFTHDFSGQPILVTRDERGQVGAFLNVCRHRGARVAEGCGQKRSFVCPYHAWTYKLNGAIAARPEAYAFESIPREGNGLKALPTCEQDGLIWVIPEGDRELNVTAHLGGLAEELAAFGLSGFHHYKSQTLCRRMNWKLLVDTFLESYHFCVLHKDSICSIFYDNLTAFDQWGANFRIVSPRRTINDLRSQAPAEWDLLPHMVGIYILFPNTVLVWQLDHIELWQIFPGPDAPEQSIVNVGLYTPEPAVTESAKRHWDNNLELVVHVVENEDFPVGEGIQRGFHSGAQDHIVFGRNEPALSYFHREVTHRLANASRD